MRQHMCDLLQCRAVAKDGKKVLEKWRCEDCLALTPQCKRYKRRRDRRNLSSEEKKDLRLARHARKIRYRQMKRAQIKQDRRARREKLRQLRNSRRQQKKLARAQKKSSEINAWTLAVLLPHSTRKNKSRQHFMSINIMAHRRHFS